MAKEPAVTISSTVVKILKEPKGIVYRHFFEWSDRKTTSQILPRIKLLSADGKELLPKPVGFNIPKEDGKPTPRYMYVDADQEAAGFEYYTATITSKTDSRIDTITSKREDLRWA